MSILKNILLQRSPNILDAGPNSRSYQHPWAGLLCVLKKNTKKQNKKPHAHHHSRLYTGIAIYFICSKTCLQCDFMKLVLLLRNSCSIWLLDTAIRRVSCICASKIWFRYLDLQYLTLRNELFAKINTSKHPNQF